MTTSQIIALIVGAAYFILAMTIVIYLLFFWEPENPYTKENLAKPSSEPGHDSTLTK